MAAATAAAAAQQLQQQTLEAPARRFTRVDWMDPPAPNAPALPVPLVNGACGIVEKRALHVGGFRPATGACVNAVAEFDFATKVWSCAGIPQFPHAVSEAGMAVVAGAYYVYGGWGGEEVLGDLHCLQTQGAAGEARDGAWACLYKAPRAGARSRPAGLHPRPRRAPSVAAGTLQDRPVIFVFGGFSGTRRLNDLWAFSIQDRAWISIRTAGGSGPTPRDGAVLVFEPAEQRLIVFGGYDDAPSSSLHELRLAGAEIEINAEAEHTVANLEWGLLRSSRPPTARYGCFGVVCGNFLVVGFGHDAEGPSRLVFQLNLADHSWTVSSFECEDPTALADARWGAAMGAAADGKRLLVVGGCTADARYLVSSADIELERTEPQAKGKR